MAFGLLLEAGCGGNLHGTGSTNEPPNGRKTVSQSIDHQVVVRPGSIIREIDRIDSPFAGIYFHPKILAAEPAKLSPSFPPPVFVFPREGPYAWPGGRIGPAIQRDGGIGVGGKGPQPGGVDIDALLRVAPPGVLLFAARAR